MRKKLLVINMKEELEPITKALEQVAEDKSVPSNIRRDCRECIETLKSDRDELSVRINSCTSVLDEVSNDANIPMYTRTQIWNIVSMLESVSRE